VPLFALIFPLDCVAAEEGGIKNRAGFAQCGKRLISLGRIADSYIFVGRRHRYVTNFCAKIENCTKIRLSGENTRPAQGANAGSGFSGRGSE
jgi:hypothetical protein